MTHHDNIGISGEELGVYICDNAYGKSTNGRLDIRSTSESQSRKMIGCPAAAGDENGYDLSLCMQMHKISIWRSQNKKSILAISLRHKGAWFRKLRNSEYVGTQKKAIGSGGTCNMSKGNTKANTPSRSPHQIDAVRCHQGPSDLCDDPHM